jgi:hypothetical protein
MHLLRKAPQILMSSCNTRASYYSGIILNLSILLHQLSIPQPCKCNLFTACLLDHQFFNVFFLLGWGKPWSTSSATSWAIVPALDDRRVWGIWWNENWQGTQNYSEKPCPNATLDHHFVHVFMNIYNMVHLQVYMICINWYACIQCFVTHVQELFFPKLDSC